MAYRTERRPVAQALLMTIVFVSTPVLAVGWTLNLIHIFTLPMDHVLTNEVMLRYLGIPLFPLGGVMGLLEFVR